MGTLELLLILLYLKCGHGISLPIIETDTLASPKQFPSLAPIFHNTEGFLCGSTIISEKHLLTVAHCIIYKRSGYYARMCSYDLSDDNGVRQKIIDFFIHPDYNDSSDIQMSQGDIAILMVEKIIQFNDCIQSALLPDELLNIVNVIGEVAGYGIQKAHDFHQNKPHFVKLQTIDKWTCLLDSKYLDIVSKRSVCAGNGIAIPCQGDSGGAFYCYDHNIKKVVICGVVSHGVGQCDPKKHIAIVNVAEYRTWIDEIINPNKATKNNIGRNHVPCHSNAIITGVVLAFVLPCAIVLAFVVIKPRSIYRFKNEENRIPT